MAVEQNQPQDPFKKPKHAPDHPYWHKDKYIRMVDFVVNGVVLGQYDEASQIRNFAYDFYSRYLFNPWVSEEYALPETPTPEAIYERYQAWKQEWLEYHGTSNLDRRTLAKFSLYDAWVQIMWEADNWLHTGGTPEDMPEFVIRDSAKLDQLAAAVLEAHEQIEKPPAKKP
jgi:hypothetical protein